MKHILTIITLLIFTGVMTSCEISPSEELPTSDPNLIETIVAATLTAAAYSGSSGPQPTKVIESTFTPTIHVPETTSTAFVTTTPTPDFTDTPRSNVAVVSGGVCFRDKNIPAIEHIFPGNRDQSSLLPLY